MSDIVGDTGCPKCLEAGGDKTRNHLMMFDNGNAYCNRCGYKTNWKEKEIPFKERKEITDDELSDLLSEFKSCPFVAYADRGLSQRTVERYGARVGVHPTDRSRIGSYLLPLRHRLPDKKLELTGFKVRLADEKKFWCQGRVKDAVLFGEELLPNQPFKKLFITESPMDAMALHQAIIESNKGTKWADLIPNVVGLPHGTGCAVDVINKSMDKIKLAEEVILVFDPDEAGQDAANKVKSLLPNVKSVALPGKDPNDMLLNGEGNQLAKMAMWGYEAVKVDGVVDISDIEDDIVKVPEWGTPYPWPTLTQLTYGIRNEVIGFTGGVGGGKTAFRDEMVAKDLLDDSQVVGLFPLEETAGRAGKGIIGKMKHILLHKPDVDYDEEEIRQEIQTHKGKLKLYNHKGVKDWEDIKKAIRHMVVVEGCKKIYFDNVTALVAHLASSEANDELNKIMSDVGSMTHELGFAFIYFAHLNPPKTGPSHERGGKILESQLTGSRAMIKWSNYIIGLERNKDPDLPEYERNTTTVVLLKDREFGHVGKFKVYYNPETGNLTEMFQ